MRKNIKNLKSTLGIIIIFTAALLAIITKMNSQLNNKFRDNGIATKAVVAEIHKKSESSGIKSSDIIYSADIHFFTKKPNFNLDTTANNNDSLYLFKNLYKNIRNVSNIENYTTAKIEINKKMFDTLRKNDEINILYLRQNPKQAKIKEAVEQFNNSIAYIFWGILSLIGLVLIILNNKVKK